MSWTVRVRLGTNSDIEAVRDVEVAAGQLFAAIGMDEIASDPPPPRRLLRTAIAKDMLWVAEKSDGGKDAGSGSEAILGYGFGSYLDNNLHLEQVSVRPECARRGIGAEIFLALESDSGRRGASMSTLFTSAQVLWNAPYYERLGYQQLPTASFGPQLSEAFRLEQLADGDAPERIAMYKRLG
ncbi:MAG: GNAT family N-acetyltransferase [Actinobacteria bacterium]|nr:GNAT family N-acetyltransferase [Actinomycetota bacterium]